MIRRPFGVFRPIFRLLVWGGYRQWQGDDSIDCCFCTTASLRKMTTSHRRICAKGSSWEKMDPTSHFASLTFDDSIIFLMWTAIVETGAWSGGFSPRSPKIRAFHSSEPSWERLIFVKYDKTAAYMTNMRRFVFFLIDISKPQIADAIKLTGPLFNHLKFSSTNWAMVEATSHHQPRWLIFFLKSSQDLDAVRATKATKMVQGHVDRLQETMHLAQVGDLEMA